MVVELTERALTERPAEVLAAVAWLRERGCGIALDDVGVDERSLALMPFLAPDVIKLDMSPDPGPRPTTGRGARVNAVAAEAERSGACCSPRASRPRSTSPRARAVGATLGQGWLFGRPGAAAGRRRRPTPSTACRCARTSRCRRHAVRADRRPRRVRRGDKRLLLALSRQLEAEASTLGGEAVVLATFQDAAVLHPAKPRRYEALARSAALVGALGLGLGREPAAASAAPACARTTALLGEWDVVVIGPHFAGAFVGPRPRRQR